jgi:hypothetical protein
MLTVAGLAVAACRIGYDPLDLVAAGAGSTAANAGIAGALMGPDDLAGGAGGLPPRGAGSDDPTGDAGAPSECPDALMLVENGSPSPPPAVTCSYPGALICDDFEGGQAAHWKVWVTPPSVGLLQSCHVHRGSFALLARPEAPNTVQVQQLLVPEVSAGSVYLRTFVYLPGAAQLPEWMVIYEMWDSPESWTDKISLDVLADGSLNVNNSSSSGPGAAFLSSGTTLLPRDRWTCLELEVVVDKTNGSARVFMDDAEVAATSGPTRTRGNKPFVTVSHGAVVAQGSLEIYFDDFVVATERIGCQ